MKQNKFNRLTTYEDIFARFETILNEYLELFSGKRIKNFNLSQKSNNYDGFKNRLIENGLSPKELICEIKDSYLRRDYLSGKIGTVDGDEQYDGIFNTALLMLMSNRLWKYYEHELRKNKNLDNSQKLLYEKKIEHATFEKNRATTQLIYSLFIYKETVNSNDFFYGHRLDFKNKSTLVIDLPVYGQISTHFGSKDTLELIKYQASKNINNILQCKLDLGQITKEKYDELKSKVNAGDILPEYSGKLYEYVSAIPLDYQGENFKKAQDDLKLSKKLITEYTNDDIERISKNRKYNSRELYYWAVKSDFTKEQLENLSHYLQERDAKDFEKKANKKSSYSRRFNSKYNGKKAVALTTAEERKQVADHEAKFHTNATEKRFSQRENQNSI